MYADDWGQLRRVCGGLPVFEATLRTCAQHTRSVPDARPLTNEGVWRLLITQTPRPNARMSERSLGCARMALTSLAYFRSYQPRSDRKTPFKDVSCEFKPHFGQANTSTCCAECRHALIR